MNHIHLLNLKPTDKKYSESCGKGLSLIVYPSGRKVWSFHGRIEGKVITKSLGDFPEISEKSARALIHAFTAGKTTANFADALKKLMELKVANKKITATGAEKKMRIFRNSLPALCAMKIEDITAPIAIAHLQPVADETKTMAQYLAQMIKETEIFAVNIGLKSGLCLQGILKAFPSVVANTEHRTSCHPSEFDKVLAGLAKSGQQALVYFGIYTLLRESEIVAARAEWINRDTMSIDVPAEVMKMKRPHRIPITPQINELLKQLPPNGWLFPSPMTGKNLTANCLKHQFKPVRHLCCVHGIRSVGRTFMSENGVPFDVAEECLAHVRGNAVSRAYDRSDLLEERREVMRKWCEFVDSKRPK